MFCMNIFIHNGHQEDEVANSLVTAVEWLLFRKTNNIHMLHIDNVSINVIATNTFLSLPIKYNLVECILLTWLSFESMAV